MDMFICHKDGVETGPFCWVDIFVMLNKGELDDSALVRIDSETKSISDWNHWSEGTDVGPFTWDEISTMLDAGVLNLDVKAKLEGTSELSRLQDVISQSREVQLPGENARTEPSPNLSERMSQAFRTVMAVPHARIATAGAFLLVLIGIIYFGVNGGNQELPSESNREVGETVEVEVPPLGVPESHQDPVPTLVADSTPAPAPTEKVDQAVAVAEPVSPNSTLLAEEPAIPASSSSTSPLVEKVTSETDSEGHPSEKVAKNEALSPPTSNPPESAPEPPAPSQAQNPDLSPEQKQEVAQVTPSPIPAPKPSATPQTTVATSLRDFFEIRSIKFLKKEPKDGRGVWKFIENEQKRIVPEEFQPCLKVEIMTNANITTDKLMAKAYFFDHRSKLIASAAEPSKVGTKAESTHYGMPILFHKEQPAEIYFEVPEKIRATKWTAVIVFGDKHEAQSICYPHSARDFLLKYPEKELVYDRTKERVARKPAMDPLIEHVVKTKNPRMPKITLFLRPPKGITDPDEIRGVMAICILASGVESMKRELQKEEMTGDYNGLFSFANKEKLAILAWGARSLWNPNMNYDDLAKEQAKEIDKSFDIVAKAWEQGVKELCTEYGIPDHNFLLWGSCGSAQWAHRLCLRKPDYFLAIAIHIPGSFDKPTPEANKVLWCLTTGELYGGYERSKRFVADCRKLGYPIMFKAIVGLGHAGHPDATALNFEFLKFALTQKESREKHDDMVARRLGNTPESMTQPWPQVFQKPPHFGDMVNQEIFPSTEVQMIPEGFRVPIPTKELADIWARSE